MGVRDSFTTRNAGARPPAALVGEAMSDEDPTPLSEGGGVEGDPNRPAEVVERLVTLGLTPEEARVYVHLCRVGPSKASDVSTPLRLQRTETYRTLQSLVDRGFVNASLGRPTIYEACAPDRLFGELIRDKVAQTRNLLQAQARVVPMLLAIAAEESAAATPNSFKMVQGRKEAYRTMDRMLRDAKSEIALFATHDVDFQIMDAVGAWDLMLHRAREGSVPVRAILASNLRVDAMLKDLDASDALSVRHVDAADPVRFLIVDRRELLMFVVHDRSSRLSSEHDVALWTSARDFVRTQHVLFELAWDAARAS